MTDHRCILKRLIVTTATILLGSGCTQVGDPLFTIEPSGASGAGYGPVLEVVQARCDPCHTSSASGGLDLSSPQGFEAGGISGPTYVACDPDASLIVCRMEGDSCGQPMPLGGSVSTQEIAAFRQYISQDLCGDVTSFADILGIFEDSCSGCHIGGAFGGLDLSSEEGLLAGGVSGPSVVACDADASLLICKVTGGSDCGSPMPLSGDLIAADEVELLRSYINSGAGDPQACGGSCSDGVQNGDETGIDCGGSCDPCVDVVDFGQVSSIFTDRNCTFCHDQGSADATLAFDFSYANMLKQPGEPGAPRDAPLIVPCDSDNSLLFKLLSGPVTLDSGATIPQMPQGQEALSAEELELIKRWIDDGAQESADPAFTCPTP